MNSTGEQFVSRADFARMRGWNRSYVTKLSQQGRLVLSPDGKLVDVPATLARLSESSDPGRAHVAARHAADRTEKHVSAYVRPDAPSGDGVVPPKAGADGVDESGYWKSKGRREAALAEMAELELQSKMGALVDRAKVEHAVESLHRMLRDNVLGLPTRLAPELASMTDAFEIEVKMRTAIRALLEDLSKLTTQDLGQFAGRTH